MSTTKQIDTTEKISFKQIKADITDYESSLTDMNNEIKVILSDLDSLDLSTMDLKDEETENFISTNKKLLENTLSHLDTIEKQIFNGIIIIENRAEVELIQLDEDNDIVEEFPLRDCPSCSKGLVGVGMTKEVKFPKGILASNRVGEITFTHLTCDRCDYKILTTDDRA